MTDQIKIGLALGGGAVLGAAHIGVIKAIEELDIPISCISGTSIGAFVAALYAFGFNSKKLQETVIDLDWLDISKLSLNKMGLLSNARLGELVANAINDKNFSEANIPLSIVASDIVKGDKVVLNKGNVAKAVEASTCVPGIFTPVTINEKILVDGGILENIPITPLKELNCTKIISVDLTHVGNVTPKNVLDVLMNAFNIALSNAAKLQQEDSDVMIAPDLSEFNLIDTKQISKLIDIGYQSAKSSLKTFEHDHA